MKIRSKQQRIRSFFVDKDNRVVVFQIPNIPLIIWLVSLLLVKTLPAGHWQLWAGNISSIALLIWSIAEIGWGRSYFRRALGLVVLSILIFDRFY